MGKLIVFSGLDGCGKSTQIDKCIQKYKQKNKKCISIWSRGGYTPGLVLAKKTIRFLLQKNVPKPGHSQKRDNLMKNKKVSKIWLVFSIIDMIFYYGIYFRWLKLRGYTIFADRYLLDSFIDFKLNFQSLSFYKWTIWKTLSHLSTKPDFSLFLELPFDTSLKRRDQKFEPFPDSVSTLKNRLILYQEFLSSYNYQKIDASLSVNDVFNQITNITK